jgi:Zn-dependent protease
MIFRLTPYEIAALLPPLLLSLTAHEFAHARVALAFGDPTARNMGRVTLNPLAHLDPIGTIALLVVGFGWARPVPVNPLNLHPRRMGNMMVSLAGPATNLALAFVAGGVLRILIAVGIPISPLVKTMLEVTMGINVVLCVFNLIPLYPLDGHHIVREFLPWRTQDKFMRWQLQYGMFALMILLVAPRFLAASSGQRIRGPIVWIFDHAIGFMETILGF